MKKSIAVLFFLLLSFPFNIYAGENIRGLWVIRNDMETPESIECALQVAKKGGFNTVFLQIVGRGHAFYRSNMIPHALPVVSKNHKNFDPLEFALKKAHELGLSVHVWINILFTWGREDKPVNHGHVLCEHPDWFMMDSYGNRPGIIKEWDNKKWLWFLSPGVPEVGLYVTRIVREVVDNYDVDGVHLDYIRYPGNDFDFNPVVVDEFKKKFKVDPAQFISDNITTLDGIKLSMEEETRLMSEWYDFRAQRVTRIVEIVSRSIRDSKEKSVQLSCAVKSQVDQAYVLYGQNWIRWLNDGIVDFICPMNYTKDDEAFVKNTEYALEKMNRGKLVVGIGAHLLDKNELAEQIKAVNRLSVDGYSIFSYTVLVDNPEFIEVLKDNSVQITSD